jgi:hypothetical protein
VARDVAYKSVAFVAVLTRKQICLYAESGLSWSHVTTALGAAGRDAKTETEKQKADRRKIVEGMLDRLASGGVRSPVTGASAGRQKGQSFEVIALKRGTTLRAERASSEQPHQTSARLLSERHPVIADSLGVVQELLNLPIGRAVEERSHCAGLVR